MTVGAWPTRIISFAPLSSFLDFFLLRTRSYLDIDSICFILGFFGGEGFHFVNFIAILIAQYKIKGEKNETGVLYICCSALSGWVD